MRTINTTLVHADSGENITIQSKPAKAFNDVFSMGFVLNSKDPKTKQFATDATGLQIVKDSLEYTQNECLLGLSGIGALLLAADPVNLTRNDLENVGILIKNLAEFSHEAKDHLESINEDIESRAGLISDPKQAAYHFNVHTEAREIRKSRSMSYADAVAMAAGRMAVREADAQTEASQP
ncbi:hypothetical protein A1507_22850 [Methylomonas koyamae]|uniref:Uncharacterized protein n=1 Tax=Methylomonas koyamae TaxID=702114 RepID=A0A177NR84_9GAMM|nr:hypothetical protein [Methylomonas koyamae]OAI20421.1 hypothetical protein A1507_22850 [Methylomonas koyamae]